MIESLKMLTGVAGRKGLAAAAVVGLLMGAGTAGLTAWTAQGWRKDAQIAKIERGHALDREAGAHAALAAVEAARTEERRRLAAMEKQRDDAQKKATAAAVDADRARIERGRLLERINALVGTAVGRDPRLADGSPAGADAVSLLAHMLGRVSRRAEELAAIADRARIAGLTCERSYDQTRSPGF